MTVDVETTDDVEEVNEEIESEEAEQEDAVEDPTVGLKKALQAERKERREADKRAKALEQQLADKDKPAEEAAIEQARREAREEVLSTSNARLVRAELKAALTGKVSNPAVALRLIDASGIDVDADGDVDADAVASAIEALLVEAPELAAKPARFQGGADQGAKGKNSQPAQLTQADLQNLSPDQVNEARRAGRLNNLLGIK